MPVGDMETSPAPLGLKGQGEFTDDTSRTQFPAVVGRVVIIKALAANTNPVYVGGSATTVIDGTTDTTTGLQLSAGESVSLTLGTLSLDELYLIAVTSGEGVTYLVYG